MSDHHNEAHARLRVTATLLWLVGCVLVWSGANAKSASCSIQPKHPTVDVGGKVHWSVLVKHIGRKGGSYSWHFHGETGPPARARRQP
jgi:hypothetical protein